MGHLLPNHVSLSSPALLVMIVAFPALGALTNGLAGRWLSRSAVHAFGVGSVAISFVLSVVAFFRLAGLEAESREIVWHGWEWVGIRLGPPLGAADDIRIPVEPALRLDNLSAVMILVVTGVGSLIHLYSTQYMHEDASPARFFCYLNLFMFA